MRVLFLHHNFPAQFRHLAVALAKDPANQVVFVTQNPDGGLPGVTKLLFKPTRRAGPETHRYVRQFENAVLDGQAVFRVLQELRNAGFVPDLIYSHTGWGMGMFVKDIFPSTPLILYCEWYTAAHDCDPEFDRAFPLPLDEALRYRASNAAMLLDLESSDAGIAPTHWQRSRFPQAFQPRIEVLHDGVNTDYFKPRPGASLNLPGLDLSHVAEIVTYVARGMDSYRGFPQLMEALALLLERRPQCHAVIVAADRIAYGPEPPEKSSYKEWMLSRLSIDPARLHFAGTLPYGLYRQVLQASSVHVYLTRPFVLSWSMIEAMASGCLVVASATAPVREVIEDGVNGLLTDFFDSGSLAARIGEALDAGKDLNHLRLAARQTVLDRYALADLLPRQVQFLQRFARGN